MNDLLDLAMPNMGTDFGQLAQQSKPTMMPLGSSPLHALMYQMDQSKHDQFLNQASQLAQLDAQMKAKRADEFGAAGPGRMAEIDTKNQLAQNENSNIDTLKATQTAKGENALTAEHVKKIKGEVEKLAPFLNAYDKAETYQDRQAIQQAIKERGAKFGNQDLGSMPFEQFDTMMRVLRHAQTNDPKLATEELKAGSKERVAEIGARSRTTVAGMRTEAAAALKKAGYDQHHYATLYDDLMAKDAKEGLTPEEANTLKNLMIMRAQSSETKAATAPPKMTLENGKIKTTQPEAPAIPEITPRQPSAEAPKNDLTVAPANAVAKYRELLKKFSKDPQMVDTIKKDFQAKGWVLPSN